jgi:putative SOS response-associated peptidase YedK
MCGRVQLTHSAYEVAVFFDLPPAQIEFEAPRFNVAPGARLPAMRLADRADRRQGAMLRWGLVPAWAKDEKIGYRMINARSETAAEKPSFRSAWRQRRCAVAVSGYYEWWRRKPKARPERAFRFYPLDEPMFALAGLWERWTPPAGGDPVETCTILTTDAAEPLRAIHDRMPVMLSSETLREWVSDGPAPPLARIAPAGRTQVRVAVDEVSTFVNDARHEGPECAAPDPPPSIAVQLMKRRGWAAGFQASGDGPEPRWVDPETGQPGRLDPSDPALARQLLAEMEAAEVDLTGISALPAAEVAEAWLSWQR